MDTNECVRLLDESVEVSKRVNDLRDKYFATTPPLCIERARLYTQSFKKTENEPISIRRALAIEHVLKNISLYISDGELFAGGLAEKPRGSSVFPEFSVQWIIDELNGKPCTFEERENDPYIVEPEVRKELLEEVLPYWLGKTQEDMVCARLPEDTKIAGTNVKGFDGSWILMSGDGHTIPDFKKVLNVGLEGIIKEAEECLSKLDLADPEEFQKVPFYQSVIIVNKAVMIKFLCEKIS